MIDMPPECPSGITLADLISVYSRHVLNNTASGGYPCFIQTPDNLKGNALEGYPYFDFDTARKQNDEPLQLQENSLVSAEISQGEFYLALLLGGITFLAFAVGFLAGFIPQG
ncbi:hypothetical protein AB2Z78_002221 [Salmonella enterica]